MKIVITIFFLSIVNQYSFSQDIDEYIIWSDSSKLEWNDFQGQIDYSSSVEKYEPTEALSTIGVDFFYIKNENDRFYYTVNCVFYKSKSWKKSTSRLLLDHEQLHFDIYELGMRHTRKKLIRMNEKGLGFDITEMVGIGLDSTELIQEKYDNETDYGTIEGVQNKWSEKIEDELINMSNFCSEREIYIKN